MLAAGFTPLLPFHSKSSAILGRYALAGSRAHLNPRLFHRLSIHFLRCEPACLAPTRSARQSDEESIGEPRPARLTNDIPGLVILAKPRLFPRETIRCPSPAATTSPR